VAACAHIGQKPPSWSSVMLASRAPAPLRSAYEFYAAFVYDNRGDPRFLVAERSGAGARDASITLDQLGGFCPMCAHAATTRRAAGTLRRVYSSTGVLERIVLDAGFANGLSGNWKVDDTLQMLDGNGRAQGCAP
jgi:hypothetical protein